MNLEGIKILLVEDNASDAHLFRELVRNSTASGLKMEHVTCLKSALEQISNDHFDVVLLDLTLPDEGGLATVKRMHAGAPNVPIVVLTGLEDEDMAGKSLRAGAQDYLVKGSVDGDLLVRSMRYATERGRAVEALERREEHYRSLIENSLDLVSILNFDGTIRYASPSHERILGYAMDELVGRNALEFVHPDDFGAVQEALARLHASASIEFRFRHKDGTWRVVESVGRNLASVPGVRGVVINSRDITDRRRLEEQLHHSQRLEAMGRLAGGVAHDFNNLLMVISGYSQMLLDKMLAGDPARDDLGQIVKAAKRATDLTHQLLAFSRRHVTRPALINLNDLMLDMDRMLRRVMGEDIEVVTELGPDLKRVHADPGQIEQVILNIAVNARDAMPRGGKFTIKTAACSVREDIGPEQAGLEANEYAMLSLADTGAGMDPPVLARVFEPFFTTKEHGTGLGLSTSYGIVKRSGGDIRVESEPGRGTAFRIYLPVMERVDDDAAATGERGALEGTETILLVEDEDGVRHVVESMLKRHGYRVMATASSSEAVEVCERYSGEIDLVITDVVMPGMDGRKMAERLVEHRPAMRVLFVSGYGEPVDGLQKDAFLQKPFTSEELALKIREMFRG